MANKENHIEWYKDEERMTVSLTQGRYISRVKKLKEKYPDEVDIIENQDGSICAHLPLKALHLQIYDRTGQIPVWLKDEEEE